MPKLQPELHERYWDRNRLKAQKPCAGSCLDGGHRGCFGRGQATEGNLSQGSPDPSFENFEGRFALGITHGRGPILLEGLPLHCSQ